MPTKTYIYMDKLKQVFELILLPVSTRYYTMYDGLLLILFL